MCLSMASLILTSSTDPGILPRHSLQLAVPGLEEEVAKFIDLPLPSLDDVTSAPIQALTEAQIAAGFKWCSTCKVIRPPKCSHCKDCDNCVLRFDHHCPFVNNCIGQRNYGFFWAFLLSTACLGFTVIAGFWIFFRTGDIKDSLIQGPMLYIILSLVGPPTIILQTGVLALLGFHGWLTCRGRTTREVLKGKAAQQRHSFFAARGPSLVPSTSRVNFPMAII